MSTRPAAASIWWLKAWVAPPCLKNGPSWTDRTRTVDGVYVSVTLMIDNRDAPLTAIGTVYGPPPTLNSGPGVVTASVTGTGGAWACGVWDGAAWAGAAEGVPAPVSGGVVGGVPGAGWVLAGVGCVNDGLGWVNAGDPGGAVGGVGVAGAIPGVDVTPPCVGPPAGGSWPGGAVAAGGTALAGPGAAAGAGSAGIGSAITGVGPVRPRFS